MYLFRDVTLQKLKNPPLTTQASPNVKDLQIDLGGSTTDNSMELGNNSVSPGVNQSKLEAIPEEEEKL